jgi:hypothetical protein
MRRRITHTVQPMIHIPSCSARRSQYSTADKQAREQDLLEGLALSIECDKRPHEAKQLVENVIGPATLVVASGGKWIAPDGTAQPKLHLHWRLDKPAFGAELSRLKVARKLAAAIAGGDPTNVPAVHPIRWPGSWHRKGDPVLCTILHHDADREINLLEALEQLQGAEGGTHYSKKQKEANGHSNESTEWARLIRDVLEGDNFHDSLNRLAMRMLWAALSDEDAAATLRTLMENSTASRDDRWQARYGDIARAVSTARVKIGEQSSDNTWDDPDVSLLDGRRGELPVFPAETLPASMRDWLTHAAHGAGVTPAHVAVPLLGIASSLIGTGRRIRASRTWSQPFTIWTAIVGCSGTGKTPGIDASRLALMEIERGRRNEIIDMRLAHETREEAAKAARKKWQQAVEEADKAGTPKPIKPIEAIDPGPFVAPRLSVSDVTIEKIAVLLQVREQGMTLVADELARLFLNMRRYSNGSDKQFFLEAWNGRPFVVERLNRPPVELQHLLVGLVGGLQPDLLSRAFDGDHDGMTSRFLFAWPEEPAYKPLTDAAEEIEPEIINALGRLARLPVQVDGLFRASLCGFDTGSSRGVRAFPQIREAGRQRAGRP